MDNLTRAFEVINRMVGEGIIRKYAITGAVAAMNYIEPTATEDLDILISIDDFENQASGIATLGPLTSFLAGLGYTDFRNEGIVIEGWPVQFLPVANDLDAEGLEHAIEVEIETDNGTGPIKVKTLRPEHIVATALKIGRPKDRDRILRFVEEKVVDFELLRVLLERHNLLEAWAKFCDRMGLPDFNEPA